MTTSTAAAPRGPPTRLPMAGSAADLHGPGRRLPLRADRRDDRVQLQRPRGTAEHHLAGLHPSQLRRPLGSLAGHRPDDREHRGRRRLDDRGHDLRHDDRARADPLRVPRPRGNEPAHLHPDHGARDHPGRFAADAVGEPRGRAWLPHDPGRPHHVQHQLRGGHRSRSPRRLRPVPRGGRHGSLCRRPDDLLEDHLPPHLPGHPRGRAARVRAVDRRLRHHAVLSRPHRRPSRCGSSA